MQPHLAGRSTRWPPQDSTRCWGNSCCSPNSHRGEGDILDLALQDPLVLPALQETNGAFSTSEIPTALQLSRKRESPRWSPTLAVRSIRDVPDGGRVVDDFHEIDGLGVFVTMDPKKRFTPVSETTSALASQVKPRPVGCPQVPGEAEADRQRQARRVPQMNEFTAKTPKPRGRASVATPLTMEAADLGRVPNRVDSSPVESPKSPNPDVANGGQQVTRVRASGQQVTTERVGKR